MARSHSQQKLALKSPRLGITTDEPVDVKMPTTPRAPLMTDDPYGLKEIAKASSNMSPGQTGMSLGLVIPKSEPTNKGKASFFNRIKKSTNNKDKNLDQERSELKIEVTPFPDDEKMAKEGATDSIVDARGTDPCLSPISPLKSPTGETQSKNKSNQQGFSIAINVQPSSAQDGKKSTKKAKIQVSLEEELTLLKEELEVAQMQLESEENDEMKVEWQNEIDRVTQKIEEKEAEICAKKKQEETPSLSIQIDAPGSTLQEPQSRPELRTASEIAQPSSNDGQPEEDNLLSPTRGNTQKELADDNRSVDEDKRSENAAGEGEPSGKPKKKGKKWITSRRTELSDEQIEE